MASPLRSSSSPPSRDVLPGPRQSDAYTSTFDLHTLHESSGPDGAALDVQLWVHHDTAWLALTGILTARTVVALRQVLRTGRRFSAHQLVLDLSALRSVDTDGLDELRSAHRRLVADYSEVHVIDPPATLAPTLTFLFAAAPIAPVPAGRQARAYCGSAHHHTWPVAVEAEIPERVQVYTDASGVQPYRLVHHPRTGRPAIDRSGHLIYVPAIVPSRAAPDNTTSAGPDRSDRTHDTPAAEPGPPDLARS